MELTQIPPTKLVPHEKNAHSELRGIDTLAQATGREIERVQQSLTLHTLPEQVQQAAHAGEVDLAAAAALTEFAHDPKAIERIMKKGGGHWSYQHLIAEERHRQDTRDMLERLKAELVLAGVKVTPRPKFLTEGGAAVLLEQLVDTDGNPVDVEQVKANAGFAAYINRDYGARAVFYCPDPAAVGLRPAPNSSAAQRAEREARDAEINARHEVWEAATGVRTNFLLSKYGTAKGAKTLFRPALAELAGTSMSLPHNEYAELADTLCGCPVRELPENAGMDRLTRATVARWLAHAEKSLTELARGYWGDLDHGLRYLNLLVAEGYELADVETQLHESITDRRADEAEEEEGDEGPGPDAAVYIAADSVPDHDGELAEADDFVAA
ncbi:hypothetical protein [Glycomyces harbinensis]|uniref:Chromosome partitioning protein, ParB family n=1 Tax=Glycomyces harbinensis TaxID=58114 RepID=A0A1G6ZNC2_9ACTN|nr:hypothetical protein [Glycomyces harbinensis]SDE03992.1 chromosome partitioning protein, ParB family [Glycomyces harbinensis]